MSDFGDRLERQENLTPSFQKELQTVYSTIKQQGNFNRNEAESFDLRMHEFLQTLVLSDVLESIESFENIVELLATQADVINPLISIRDYPEVIVEHVQNQIVQVGKYGQLANNDQFAQAFSAMFVLIAIRNLEAKKYECEQNLTSNLNNPDSKQSIISRRFGHFIGQDEDSLRKGITLLDNTISELYGDET